MKVLDVKSLDNGIELILSKLQALSEQFNDVDREIEGFVSLDSSLKGRGGEEIRSFFKQFHMPFLSYIQLFISEYKSTLELVKSLTQSMEPSPEGFIRDSFIENDVQQGLKQIEQLAQELVNDVNNELQTVQDIISLPSLQDEQLQQSILKAQLAAQDTIENLYVFDHQSTASFNQAEHSLNSLKNFLKQLESMFKLNPISILEVTGISFVRDNLFSKLQEEVSLKSSMQSHYIQEHTFDRNKVLDETLPVIGGTSRSIIDQRPDPKKHAEIKLSDSVFGETPKGNDVFAQAFKYKVEGQVPTTMDTFYNDIIMFNQIGGVAKGTIVDAGYKAGDFTFHQELVSGEAIFQYGKVVGGEAKVSATFLDVGVDHEYGKLHAKVGDAKAGVEIKDGHIAAGAKADLAKGEGEVKVPLPFLDWKVVVGGEAAYGSFGGEAQFGLMNEVNVGLGIGLGVKFGVEKD